MKVSAVGIKRLYYTDPEKFTGKVTVSLLKDILGTANEVMNIHQDTWTIEESESSQDSYKNQLTGMIYRMGQKSMGDITVNFTIGQYDMELKKEFLGGIVDEEGTWARARGIVEIRKALIALTQDDVYVVLPLVNINAHEGNTDGAIGIAITGTAMEPENEELRSEYWVDAAKLRTA